MACVNYCDYKFSEILKDNSNQNKKITELEDLVNGAYKKNATLE